MSLAREGRPSSKDFIITARWVERRSSRRLLEVGSLVDLGDHRRQRPSLAIARRLHSLVVHTHYTVTNSCSSQNFSQYRRRDI